MSTTSLTNEHPATDVSQVSLPDHLLLPIVESAFRVIKNIEEARIPTSLRRIAHFDHKALNHSTARTQIINSIETSPDFAQIVEEEFFTRVEVSIAYSQWTHTRAKEIISDAAQRNDLALIASILWLKRPSHYEYALGMIVAFSEFAMDENEKKDSLRAQETQFNHIQKSLAREKERAESLKNDVSKLEEELREERRSRRAREKKLEDRIVTLENEIKQNESVVEKAKESKDRGQQRIEREASRAAELEARLKLIHDESAKKSIKIEQLQEQLASSLSSDIQLTYEDLQNLILAQNEAESISNSILKIMNKTRRILSQSQKDSSSENIEKNQISQPVEKKKTRTPVKIPAGLTINDAKALKEIFMQSGLVVLIDGYNVSLNSFEQIPLELQREKVIACATNIESRYGPTCVIVFDGDSENTRGRVHSKVHVVFSPSGKTADDLIIERVRVTPPETPILVVTNDRNLLARAKGLGCESITTQAFVSASN